MAQLYPYLHFSGNCREAMTFYQECLGGKLTIQSVGESPMAQYMPKEVHNNTLHSTLEKEGFLLLASDMMEPGAAVNGNTMTLCLVCASKEEIESAFAKLSAGGEVGHPLKEEFFGTFGDLKDKFGLSWMFQFGMAPTA